MRIDLTIRQTSGLNEASEDSHHDRGRSICLDILFESSSYACNHARPFSNHFHSHPVAMYNTIHVSTPVSYIPVGSVILFSIKIAARCIQYTHGLSPTTALPIKTQTLEMHFHTAFEFVGLNIGTVLSNSNKFRKPFVTSSQSVIDSSNRGL